MLDGISNFTRKGDNIYVTVPLTVPEAALGAKIEVPTVQGKRSSYVFRQELNQEQKFRLARARRAESGAIRMRMADQFVEAQVVLPKVISERPRSCCVSTRR
jgi:DnaJ-class molecular chaperone